MYLLFCFVTGLWIVSAEMSAVDFCYCFLALKRTALALVILCLRLEGSTPIQLYQDLFWEFGDMEFGYVTLDLDIYKVCTF